MQLRRSSLRKSASEITMDAVGAESPPDKKTLRSFSPRRAWKGTSRGGSSPSRARKLRTPPNAAVVLPGGAEDDRVAPCQVDEALRSALSAGDAQGVAGRARELRLVPQDCAGWMREIGLMDDEALRLEALRVAVHCGLDVRQRMTLRHLSASGLEPEALDLVAAGLGVPLRLVRLMASAHEQVFCNAHPGIQADETEELSNEGEWRSARPSEAHVLEARGTLEHVIRALVNRYYVTLVEPKYAEMLVRLHEYLEDVGVARCVHQLYALLAATGAPWRDEARIRLLNWLRLYLDARQGAFSDEFISLWPTLFTRDFLLPHGAQDACVGLVDTVLAIDPAKRPPPVRPVPPLRPVEQPNSDVLQWDAQEVAASLTHLSTKLFDAIPTSELLMCRWKEESTGPRYNAMVRSFNEWQWWTASQVVRRTDTKERVAMIQLLLHIAVRCRKANNFHACFAIYAGLSCSAVDRLKKTWRRVNSKGMQRQQQLKALFAPDKNHLAYQRVMAAATPPVVPYLPLTSKFLFAIEDSNPTILDNGMINIHKLRQLFSQMTDFTHWKRGYEAFSMGVITSHYQYFNSHLDFLSEKEAYELSLQLEPREVQK